MRTGLAAVAIALVVAGCGGTANTSGDGSSATTTAATTTEALPAETETTSAKLKPMTLHLYFLAPDGKLVAVNRDVGQTETPGAETLRELLDPPDGMTTEVPSGLNLTIDNGRATVSGAPLNQPALAQVVYALTTFPTVDSVNGKTRTDVEPFVPAILVEQPTDGEFVTSPLHMTGNANTYEATFNYRLEDAAGRELAKDFVTATSGNGTRGTFDVTIPFNVDTAQDGALKVFELSAEDGSVVHQRVIPLHLEP